MSAKHNVRIYTIANCPYCTRAKALLNKKEIEYEEVFCESSQDLPKDLTTFPQIYFDLEYIGGCQELFNYFRGL